MKLLMLCTMIIVSSAGAFAPAQEKITRAVPERRFELDNHQLEVMNHDYGDRGEWTASRIEVIKERGDGTGFTKGMTMKLVASDGTVMWYGINDTHDQCIELLKAIVANRLKDGAKIRLTIVRRSLDPKRVPNASNTFYHPDHVRLKIVE